MFFLQEGNVYADSSYFTSSPVFYATVGIQYTYDVTYYGGNATLVVLSSPSWLKLNKNNVLSGIPTNSGNSNTVSIALENGGNVIETQNFGITVSSSNVSPGASISVTPTTTTGIVKETSTPTPTLTPTSTASIGSDFSVISDGFQNISPKNNVRIQGNSIIFQGDFIYQNNVNIGEFEFLLDGKNINSYINLSQTPEGIKFFYNDQSLPIGNHVFIMKYGTYNSKINFSNGYGSVGFLSFNNELIALILLLTAIASIFLLFKILKRKPKV